MVRDAEEHAAEDKARREAAEIRNNAEQLAYSVDKVLADNDDKLPEDVKTEVKADVDALKTALAGRRRRRRQGWRSRSCRSRSRKLGEAIYACRRAEGAASDGAAPEGASAGSAGAEEDIVDAEIVDEDAADEKK